MLPGTLRESEHAAQSAVVEWARWSANRVPALRWLFAVPNGAKLPYRKARNGRRYSKEAVHLIEEGLTSGVADLFLPVPIDNYHGLFIEMKVGRNTTTAAQKEFLRDMQLRGYAAMVCYGSEMAIAAICMYLDIGKDG